MTPPQAPRSPQSTDPSFPPAERGLLHELRLFLVALQFLTRVPIPPSVGFREAWLHDSARHFPAVGLLVGGAGAAVLALGALLFPLPLAVLLSMAATVLLTGAFHEDGVADTCDALGGAVTRERALAIMKDSRIGTYGALGLGFTLAIKAAALTALAGIGIDWAVVALVVGHAASRTASVALIHALPYAGDPEHAKAKPLAQRIGRLGLAVACAWTVTASMAAVAAGFSGGWPALGSGVLAAALTAWACACWFRRRLGGVTGDTLGATQGFSEVALYLGLLAAATLADRWLA